MGVFNYFFHVNNLQINHNLVHSMKSVYTCVLFPAVFFILFNTSAHGISLQGIEHHVDAENRKYDCRKVFKELKVTDTELAKNTGEGCCIWVEVLYESSTNAVVHLSSDMQHYDCYVFLKAGSKPGDWIPVGNVNYFNHYQLTSEKIVKWDENRAFLVVRNHYGGSMVGYSNYESIWYLLCNGSYNEVLTYHTECYHSGTRRVGYEYPFDTQVTTKIKSTHFSKNEFIIDVNINVSYSFDIDQNDLESSDGLLPSNYSGKIRYGLKIENDKFLIDYEYSDILKKSLEKLCLGIE